MPKPPTLQRRMLAVVQYFHQDKMGGFRRIATFLEGNDAWLVTLPTHRPEVQKVLHGEKWQHVKFERIGVKWPKRGWLGGWSAYSAIYTRRLLRSEPPLEVLYVIAPPSWFALPAALVARAKHIPIVIDIGDPAASQATGIAQSLQLLAEKTLINLASKVIVASPAIYPHLHPEVVISGIGEEFFALRPKALPHPVALYYGSFTALQRVDRLVDLWSRVVKLLPKARLLLVGKGTRGEEAQLAQLVSQLGLENNVELRDRVNPQQVPQLLAEATCALIPLNTARGTDYAIPTKLLECMAAGLPVIGIGGEQSRALIDQTSAGAWMPADEAFGPGGAVKIAGILQQTRSTATRDFAERKLRQEQFQHRMNTITAGSLPPWSATVQRGVDWVMRHAVVPLPDGAIAVRHSLAPSRVADADNWAYIEITAYTISLLAGLHYISGRDEYLDRAQQLATWLAACQTPTGGFPFVYHLTKKEFRGPCFSFDAAMAVRAFAQLHLLDANSQWREAALRAAGWLVREMQRPDGSFIAAQPAAGLANDPLPSEAPDCYFGSGGALHIKHLLALHGATQLAPDAPDLIAARQKLLEWSTRLLRREGGVVQGAGTPRVRPHTHCYALEGFTSVPDLRDELHRHVVWTARQIERHKYLPEWIEEPHHGPPATDATAQAMRLMALVVREGTPDWPFLYRATAQTARRLRRAQRRDGSWPESPRLSYRRYGPPVWPTLFAISAFAFWERPELEIQWLF